MIRRYVASLCGVLTAVVYLALHPALVSTQSCDVNREVGVCLNGGPNAVGLVTNGVAGIIVLPNGNIQIGRGAGTTIDFKNSTITNLANGLPSYVVATAGTPNTFDLTGSSTTRTRLNFNGGGYTGTTGATIELDASATTGSIGIVVGGAAGGGESGYALELKNLNDGGFSNATFVDKNDCNHGGSGYAGATVSGSQIPANATFLFSNGSACASGGKSILWFGVDTGSGLVEVARFEAAQANFLIGTTTNKDRLTVVDNSANATLFLESTNGSANAGIEVANSSGTTELFFGLEPGANAIRFNDVNSSGINLRQAGNMKWFLDTNGDMNIPKRVANTTAPGAANAKFEVVCGTGAGSAKLIMYAGTSTTAVTVIDNVGSGVTGC